MHVGTRDRLNRIEILRARQGRIGRDDPAPVVDELAGRGILAGVPVSRLLPAEPGLANDLIIASTEINTDQDRQALAGALEEVLA